MTTERTTAGAPVHPRHPGPRLVAVAMVKNECDVIELFVRINARVIDAFHILDHHSDDATVEILEALVRDGFRITITRTDDLAYRPSERFTALAREAAEAHPDAWIVPMDADEFLASEHGANPAQVVADLVPSEGYGRLRWRTFCPVGEGYFEQAAPLFHLFRAREDQGQEFPKIVLGNAFARRCQIAQGNHSATLEDGTFLEPVDLPLVMQHAPIRNREQFLRKVVTGTHIRSLQTPREAGLSFHYYAMVERLRARNFDVDAGELLANALCYSVVGPCESPALVDDGLRIGTAGDQMVWPDFARPNPLASMDRMIHDLVGLQRDTQARVGALRAEVQEAHDQAALAREAGERSAHALQRQVDSAQQAIGTAVEQNRQLQHLLHAALQQRDLALAEVGAMRQTRCWRWTAPLRALRAFLGPRPLVSPVVRPEKPTD